MNSTHRDGAAGQAPGVLRVSARFTSRWMLTDASYSEGFNAHIAGAFHYLAAGPDDYPVVGDWVETTQNGTVIQRVLPRKTALYRQTAGKESRGQLLAANIDRILLVFGLDGGRNFSIGLLERMLTVTAASGARPVVVLNKADLAEHEYIDSIAAQVRSAAGDIPVCITAVAPDLPASQEPAGCGLASRGADALLAQVPAGTTACCIGRSGVGKSSIMNALLGRPQQRTAATSRIEHRGRHTTSTAQLQQLPGGGLLIDTPGLRELQLWGDEDALGASFADVHELAADCRFRDCRHKGEPDCAVQAAVAQGILPAQRLEHFLEQRDELAVAEQRSSMSADAYEKQKWKRIKKDIRRRPP